MLGPRLARPAIAVALVALLSAADAFAQVLVAPRRATQSRVRYFDFRWRFVDLQVGVAADTSDADRVGEALGDAPRVTLPPPPTSTTAEAAPDVADPVQPPLLTDTPTVTVTQTDAAEVKPETGGIRLYFYERAEPIAERAAASIVARYQQMIGEFRHVPRRTFPYVLYSSYIEFLQTNLFPLQEGVLGVTSPQDLKLTLPYFGDHRLFAEVSAHELAHQFTIQKVRDYARDAGVRSDPLRGFPLWFIEGLAEIYAHGGLTPEAEMAVRDLQVNPDAEIGYVMLNFYADRPWSGLWTYRIGHVRCAFLEEEYGAGTIQDLLEASPRMVGEVAGKPRVDGFSGLVEAVTGDEPRVVTQRFADWVKRKTFGEYLESTQQLHQLELLDGEHDLTNALTTSPDGDLILYRTIVETTFQSRLVLVDRRAPKTRVTVAVDGVPGVESLHPVWGRSFDVKNDVVTFVAQREGADVLYWAPLERRATPIPRVGRAKPEELWDVELSLGSRRRIDLAEHGLIAAFAPSLSPDGTALAFVGLDFAGSRDIYVTPLVDGPAELTRITRDDYTERSLAWGERGIVYSSDATDHQRFNLFLARLGPRHGAPVTLSRLTTEAQDHEDPQVLPDGRVIFVAWEHGRSQVQELMGNTRVVRTDVVTGLFNPSPGPCGGVWALLYQAGRRTPVYVAPEHLLEVSRHRQPPVQNGPPIYPELGLEEGTLYSAASLANWELGNLFAIAGAGGGGIFGQAFFTASDLLRNHQLFVSLAISGSLELFSGFALYINQEHRLTWAGGPFQDLLFRFRRLENGDARLAFGERFFGARALAHYPINRFFFTQATLSVGGTTPVNISRFGGLAVPDDVGSYFQSELSLRLGYDTVRYHPLTGPLKGSSLLLEGIAGVQPGGIDVYGITRLDAEQFIPIFGRTHLLLRLGAGGAFGHDPRWFLLSSWFTLRGVPFNDLDFLLGHYFLYSTAELQFPLNDILRFIIFSDIEGVLGVDVGGVGDRLRGIWDRRVLNAVAGFNFALGPVILRLHFAFPINIGAPVPGDGDMVTNFSIGWIYQ